MKIKTGRLAFLLLLAFAVTSCMGNVALFQAAKTFYAQYKLLAVFPSNLDKFQAKEAFPQNPSGKRSVILFGDSRIEQWRSFTSDTTDFLVLNRGVGGETTAQLMLRLEQDVLAHSPDVVVIQAGINDLVTIGLAPQRAEKIKAQCESNLRAIVDTLLANDIQVILTTIIPPSEPSLARRAVWSSAIDTAVIELNQNLLATYGNTEDVVVLEIDQALQKEDGSWQEGVNKDTLHLTRQGYEAMDVLLKDALASLN